MTFEYGETQKEAIVCCCSIDFVISDKYNISDLLILKILWIHGVGHFRKLLDKSWEGAVMQSGLICITALPPSLNISL